MENLADSPAVFDPGPTVSRTSVFQREVEAYLERYPYTRQVDLLLTDLNGSFRGKRVALSSVRHLRRGFYFPASVYAMTVTGKTVATAGLAGEDGEPDLLCLPLAGTLKPSTADPTHCAQLQLTMRDRDGQPYDVEPRNVLNRLWQQLRARGIFPVAAAELEFYLVDRRRNGAQMPQPPRQPDGRQLENQRQVYSLDRLDHYGAVLDDIARLARLQGLPTEGAVAESAPGQFEINLAHSDQVLHACDQALQLKRLVRRATEQHRLTATFMAKPYEAWTGSGLHIHLSLRDAAGNNGLLDSLGRPSPLMARAIAGVLDLLPALMALLAPNVNAFRRFQPGGYVPLRANWGVNNRTVAVRIPCSDAENYRLEYRVVGADANPYLVVAALLAGIVHGLDGNAPLQARVRGNGALAGGTLLPLRQREALALFADDVRLPALLGERFCRLFHTCKTAELSEFERRVTATEIDWMLNNA
ncbi:glutamine synthetase family protein [Sodalis praecaptivus]|uniref:glutamine synthetase family protein n=1 Tax=Sodalis praecaptivus TaxID=1239307 RepID=UPI0027ED167F|nr:glutamine synthetase family protein [Sodalis praecaptivus]CAJ0994557.1 Gamma-glutamylputrescine synthetase PuuA [Sodalis praecaptivus]